MAFCRRVAPFVQTGTLLFAIAWIPSSITVSAETSIWTKGIHTNSVIAAGVVANCAFINIYKDKNGRFKNTCIKIRTVEYLKEVVWVSVSPACKPMFNLHLYVNLPRFVWPRIPPTLIQIYSFFEDAKVLKSNTNKIKTNSTISVPTHCFPSPTKPGSMHWQMYEPTVLIQLVINGQISLGPYTVHSSMSTMKQHWITLTVHTTLLFQRRLYTAHISLANSEGILFHERY